MPNVMDFIKRDEDLDIKKKLLKMRMKNQKKLNMIVLVLLKKGMHLLKMLFFIERKKR